MGGGHHVRARSITALPIGISHRVCENMGAERENGRWERTDELDGPLRKEVALNAGGVACTPWNNYQPKCGC